MTPPRSLPDLAAHALGGARTLCKCCGGVAPLFCAVDFNKNCEEEKGVLLPPMGMQVPYYRCPGCGFLFTRFFDHWTHGEFQAYIYNEGYAEVDPEYTTSRSDGVAQTLGSYLGASLPRLQVLDWGGGTGKLAEGLRAQGIQRAVTWDPFTPAFQAEPQGPFNLVTCIEVLEHLPDPRQGIRKLISFLHGEGGLIFSTVFQPPDILTLGTRWWYLAPRNGHLSLFTAQALACLLGERGYRLLVFDDHIQFAWTELPFWMEAIEGAPGPI